eukprot:GHVL01020456.1.p1 GENE.GHVL01020456.1~~GHVL01020456.1.p1  ORF type:complete len:675 (+),score=127.76 GHVL01020456.1:25-2049(+)
MNSPNSDSTLRRIQNLEQRFNEPAKDGRIADNVSNITNFEVLENITNLENISNYISPRNTPKKYNSTPNSIASSCVIQCSFNSPPKCRGGQDSAVSTNAAAIETVATQSNSGTPVERDDHSSEGETKETKRICKRRSKSAGSKKSVEQPNKRTRRILPESHGGSQLGGGSHHRGGSQSPCASDEGGEMTDEKWASVTGDRFQAALFECADDKASIDGHSTVKSSITSFFPRVVKSDVKMADENTSGSAKNKARAATSKSNGARSVGGDAKVATPVEAISKLNAEINRLTALLEDSKRYIDEQKSENADLLKKNDSLHTMFNDHTTSSQMREKSTRLQMIEAKVQQAKQERHSQRTEMAAAQLQLGQAFSRVGAFDGPKDEWEGGTESEELSKAKILLENDKVLVSKLRSSITQMQRRSRASLTSNATEADSTSTMSTMPPPPVLFVPPKLPEGLGITDWPVLSGIEEDFIFELKEYCNLKTSLINKEEQELKERDIRLAVDRVLHLKRLKAMKAQDSSEWSNYPLMHGGRYQLLNMIGKGGFSEVYKGFDVDSLQNVAIKIHQIKKDMGAQERINYVRHALRETEIQRKLKHPRIVSLKDRFPIDNNCFASVLEYQEGNDLDSHLKANGPLGEKEARGIITQIFSAFRVKFMSPRGCLQCLKIFEFRRDKSHTL